MKQNSFSSRRAQFLLLKSSADGMRATHFIKSKSFDIKSADSKYNSHPQNTFAATSKRVFDHPAGRHGPAPLTQKVNHHRQRPSCTIKYSAPRVRQASHQALPHARVLSLIKILNTRENSETQKGPSDLPKTSGGAKARNPVCLITTTRDCLPESSV